jgi:NAD(P)-dependent dehydrogenase (short-subunit alcohol dehydrogenase family)
MSQRVVVTGASGALGKSVVRRFLAAAQAVLASASAPASLARLADLGPTEALALYSADLSSSAAVRVPGPSP